jgi:hypothetical protein
MVVQFGIRNHQVHVGTKVVDAAVCAFQYLSLDDVDGDGVLDNEVIVAVPFTGR